MPQTVKYKSFEINNFLRFENIKLEFAGRVNLIGGRNATGKTSLLDAIFMSLGPANPQLWMNVLTRKGLTPLSQLDSSIKYLFNNLSTGRKIGFKVRGYHDFDMEVFASSSPETSSSYDSLGQAELDTSPKDTNRDVTEFTQVYSPVGKPKSQFVVKLKPSAIELSGESQSVFNNSVYLSPFQSFYQDNTVQRFSKLVEEQKVTPLVNVLQQTHPDIKGLQLITRANLPILAAELTHGVYPLSLLGSGVYKLTEILLAASDSNHGALLIDEAESGFHYSLYKNFWKTLLSFSNEYSCQLFISSHSWEFIKQGAQAIDELEFGDGFLYNRLDVDSEAKPKAVPYSFKELKASIDSDIEIR